MRYMWTQAPSMMEGTVLLIPPPHIPQTLPHLLLGVYYKLLKNSRLVYPLYYPLSKLVIVSFYV